MFVGFTYQIAIHCERGDLNRREGIKQEDVKPISFTIH